MLFGILSIVFFSKFFRNHEVSFGIFLIKIWKFYLQDHYELSSFIEYSGRLPRNAASKEIVAHYIGYRSILGEWIRNDDAMVHTTSLQGEYKVNLAFYRAMRSAPPPIFLDTSTMPVWHKSVVIRGVYRGRGRRSRGRGRGRGCAKPTSNVNDEQANILPDDSSSSSDEENAKGENKFKYCRIKLIFYTV